MFVTIGPPMTNEHVKVSLASGALASSSQHFVFFPAALPPPLEYLVFPIPTHSTTDTSKIKTAEGDPHPPFLSLSLSTVHTPPPSFQTRDDFLGQVDVPLSHLPVSYLCLRDRSDCFDTLSYFLSLSEQVFFFSSPSSA